MELLVMKSWHRQALTVSMLALVSLFPVAGSSKEIVGWAENVYLFPGHIALKAKVDTGAEISSVNCECHSFFKRDGAPWVRFSIRTNEGEPLTLERKIVRTVKIKRHYGEVQERPVVKLGICLGGVYREAEVNIVDRSGLEYPMLIGRNFMGDKFLVDAKKQYINPPHCEELLSNE